MKIRVGKAEINIPWEYVAAFIIILLALSILLVWKTNREGSETIRIMSTVTPSAGVLPAEPATASEDESYDVPDADDMESRPGNEPSGPQKVNVNKAGIEELMTLPYIGEVKARAIISYREEHGPFSTYEDLLNVKGIGTKTLERIRDYIVFE